MIYRDGKAIELTEDEMEEVIYKYFDIEDRAREFAKEHKLWWMLSEIEDNLWDGVKQGLARLSDRIEVDLRLDFAEEIEDEDDE